MNREALKPIIFVVSRVASRQQSTKVYENERIDHIVYITLYSSW